MGNYNFTQLKDIFGEPILRVDFSEYTENQKMLFDIPDRVFVFATNNCPTGIIVAGQIATGRFVLNHGYKALVSDLIKKKDLAG